MSMLLSFTRSVVVGTGRGGECALVDASSHRVRYTVVAQRDGRWKLVCVCVHAVCCVCVLCTVRVPLCLCVTHAMVLTTEPVRISQTFISLPSSSALKRQGKVKERHCLGNEGGGTHKAKAVSYLTMSCSSPRNSALVTRFTLQQRPTRVAQQSE